MSVYDKIRHKKQQKVFAVLIDPDQYTDLQIDEVTRNVHESGVDLILVGGSLLIRDRLDQAIVRIRKASDKPVVLFPGSAMQVTAEADAILLLSLISGRNPEMLIGQHVIAAPYIKAAGLEVISTGYMLIDGGRPTTASYMSNASPIPNDKNDIAVCTAMAGEMLGMQAVYLDGGSGARHPVPTGMVRDVCNNIKIPVIAGGGIKDPETASKLCQAGADMIVVGNAIEKDHHMIREVSAAIRSF